MKFISPFLIAFILLIGWSCRKDFGFESAADTSTEFWAYAAKKDSRITVQNDDDKGKLLDLAISDLQNMKGSEKFEKFVTKIGLPLWAESSEFFDAGGFPTLLVPIADGKEKTVTAMLVVNYSKTYTHFQYMLLKEGSILWQEERT